MSEVTAPTLVRFGSTALRTRNLELWTGSGEKYADTDSSIKKNNAFINKCENFSDSVAERLLVDINRLSLDKYHDEVVRAVYKYCTRELMISDSLIEVISGLHRRLGPSLFTAPLMKRLLDHLHDKLQGPVSLRDTNKILETFLQVWATGLLDYRNERFVDAIKPEEFVTQAVAKCVELLEGRYLQESMDTALLLARLHHQQDLKTALAGDAKAVYVSATTLLQKMERLMAAHLEAIGDEADSQLLLIREVRALIKKAEKLKLVLPNYTALCAEVRHRPKILEVLTGVETHLKSLYAPEQREEVTYVEPAVKVEGSTSAARLVSELLDGSGRPVSEKVSRAMAIYDRGLNKELEKHFTTVPSPRQAAASAQFLASVKEVEPDLVSSTVGNVMGKLELGQGDMRAVKYAGHLVSSRAASQDAGLDMLIILVRKMKEPAAVENILAYVEICGSRLAEELREPESRLKRIYKVLSQLVLPSEHRVLINGALAYLEPPVSPLMGTTHPQAGNVISPFRDVQEWVSNGCPKGKIFRRTVSLCSQNQSDIASIFADLSNLSDDTMDNVAHTVYKIGLAYPDFAMQVLDEVADTVTLYKASDNKMLRQTCITGVRYLGALKQARLIENPVVFQICHTLLHPLGEASNLRLACVLLAKCAIRLSDKDQMMQKLTAYAATIPVLSLELRQLLASLVKSAGRAATSGFLSNLSKTPLNVSREGMPAIPLNSSGQLCEESDTFEDEFSKLMEDTLDEPVSEVGYAAPTFPNGDAVAKITILTKKGSCRISMPS